MAPSQSWIECVAEDCELGMRIAVAAVQHESNTFARGTTGRRRFEENGLLFGDALIERWRDSHHEVAGFLAAGLAHGFQPVPLLTASATPAGPVESAFVEEIIDDLIDRLLSSKADGLLLALHGAMVTTTEPSGDTVIVRRIRQAVGPEFPIVTTLDFHANCTLELVALSHMVLCYQTNPHTDMRDKGLEAGRYMCRLAAGSIRPVQVLRKPPMILPIHHQRTCEEPLCSLLTAARALEREPGMLSVSLAAGFPYADVPAMGPSVLAISDSDPGLADRVAGSLAKQLWSARDGLGMTLPDPADAVREAITSDRAPVVLADFGDNIGGGSPGDGTVLLAELVRQGAARSVVTIADPQSVQQCVQARVGSDVRLSVGGKTDWRYGEPVPIAGVLRSLHDGRWVEPEARHGGVRFHDQGLTALVTCGAGNLLCLSSRPYPPFSLGQLTSLGIEPARQQVLVVKGAIAFRAAYEPIAARIIEVDTPGITAANPARFQYQRIRRPIWPLDPEPLVWVQR